MSTTPSTAANTAKRREISTACRHCGLPVPRGRTGFCCAGCEAVHGLLLAHGLGRFYELGGGAPVGAAPAPGRHDWLAEQLARDTGADGICRTTVDVQGIRCAACVWLLQTLFARRPGALKIELNPSLGRAALVFDPRRCAIEEWLAEVEQLGYRIAPASKRAAAAERGLLVRFGVCAALAMNAMMFAFASYAGLAAAGGDGAVHRLFQALSFALATLALLVGGPVFFRGALGGLRRRVLHLDLPIALGLLLAWGSALQLYWQRGDAGYFDTVTVFVTLMLLGRYLQQVAVRKNRDLLLANDGAEHLRARIVDGDAVRMVPVRELALGARLWLARGDLVPATARLLHQPASFSLDWICGESVPRAFSPGELVPAGAFLSEGAPAVAEVVRTPRESGLLDLLRTPQGEREDLRGRGGFWAVLNRTYAAVVLGLAALAAVLWALIDPARILPVMTSLLVVTCPCAVGIATPLAFDLALARLRRRGVFVRTTQLLEKARFVRAVFFDKTGTLTWGGARARVLTAPPAGTLPILRTLVLGSSHPVSRAVAAIVETGGIVADLRVREVPGAGLEAVREGVVYRFGSPRFAGAGEPGPGDDDTVCVFARDGVELARFAITEDLREDGAETIAALARDGYDVTILSGDRQARALRAAAALGIPPARVHAELSPAAKAALIAAVDHGDTMMVGDGLNDAPAFDAAFVAGTPALDRPVLPARADFAFVGAGLGAVRDVLATARAFHRVVRRNLAFMVCYNAVTVSLCLADAMTPLLCAVLMPISSLGLLVHVRASLGRGSVAVRS